MKTNYLKLVNQEYPVRKKDIPTLLVLAPFSEKGVLLEPRVAAKLEELIHYLKLEEKIIVIDGYRTAEKQQSIWKETMQEKGIDFTKRYVARPGCSEHEIGLAIDLGLASKRNDYIRPSFSNDPSVSVFLKEMANFGFILRYPKGKETITGISYEPWHFRYVGVPHSQIMTQQNWVLEEYLSFLKETRGKVNEQ